MGGAGIAVGRSVRLRSGRPVWTETIGMTLRLGVDIGGTFTDFA